VTTTKVTENTKYIVVFVTFVAFVVEPLGVDAFARPLRRN